MDRGAAPRPSGRNCQVPPANSFHVSLRRMAGEVASDVGEITSKSLQLVQALVEFNISSPRIGHERQGDAQVRPRRVGHIQLDPGLFCFLAKLLEAFDLEPNVIQFPSLRSYSWRIGFRKG